VGFSNINPEGSGLGMMGIKKAKKGWKNGCILYIVLRISYIVRGNVQFKIRYSELFLDETRAKYYVLTTKY